MAVAPQELKGRGRLFKDIRTSRAPTVQASHHTEPKHETSISQEPTYIVRPLYPLGDPPDPGPKPVYGVNTAKEWEVWVAKTEARNEFLLKRNRAERFSQENDLRGTF